MSNTAPSQRTVTEKSDPWTGVQPYIKDNLAKAKALSDQGGQYYGFSTVVPFSDQTNQGLLGIENTANDNSLNQLAYNSTKDTIDGDYLGGSSRMKGAASGSYNADGSGLNAFKMGGVGTSGLTQYGAAPEALSGINAMGSGAADVNNAAFSNFGTGTTPANDYLDKTARGDMLNSNPHLDGIADKVSQNVMDQVGAQFGRSGMFGSTNYAKHAAEGVADATARLYSDQYGQERDRQLQAANTIQGAHDTSEGLRLNATSTAADIDQNNMARRLNALNSSAGIESASDALGLQAQTTAADINAQNLDRNLNATNAALANDQQNQQRSYDAANQIDANDQNERDRMMASAQVAGTLSNNQYQPYERLLQAGQMREEQAGRSIQDLMNRWDYEQTQPWRDAQNYSGVINGYSNVGGTSTQSSPLYRNRLGGAIGGGLSGAAAGFGIGGPIGAGIGGGLGLLGGLI